MTSKRLFIVVLLAMSGRALATPGWVETIVQTDQVTFTESPCTEKGGFGQQFRATKLVGGAQVKSSIVGTVLKSEQFIYKESRPPYSYFEMTHTVDSKAIHALSGWIYFSTRELADQAHADLVRQLSSTPEFKAVRLEDDTNQTLLFTQPLIEKDGEWRAREGMMMDIEVVGTRMSIVCTDTALYLQDVRVFPPGGSLQPKPWQYGIKEVAEIQEPYCTRDLAFGVPFGSIPKPESLRREFSGEMSIALDRAWPPFKQFEVKLTKEGAIAEVSSWVDFNTHALAHQQALSIVKAIRDRVQIYDDTLDGRSPILHTDAPYRAKPNNDYYGIRDRYISGLAAEVNDSEKMLRVVCMRRDLRYPSQYDELRAQRDAQLKQ